MKITYKCRMCGQTFSDSVGSFEMCLLGLQIAITGMVSLWRGKIGIPPRRERTHNCGDGRLGIADLIGAVPD